MGEHAWEERKLLEILFVRYMYMKCMQPVDEVHKILVRMCLQLSTNDDIDNVLVGTFPSRTRKLEIGELYGLELFTAIRVFLLVVRGN